MPHQDDPVSRVFEDSHTIAVVGLSADPERPSHRVAAYLQAQGYRIIPVNPKHAGSRILDEACYSTLREAAAALAAEGGQIDVVDCFRRADQLDGIAAEAIAIHARCLWMQLGLERLTKWIFRCHSDSSIIIVERHYGTRTG